MATEGVPTQAPEQTPSLPDAPDVVRNPTVTLPPPERPATQEDIADVPEILPIGEKANRPTTDLDSPTPDPAAEPDQQNGSETEGSAEQTSRETQAREIHTLGTNALTRMTNEAHAQITSPETYRNASEAAQALYSLDLTKKGAIPIDFRSEPKPIEITKDGKTFRLASLDSFDGTTYSYTVIRNGSEVSYTPDQAGFIPISVQEIVTIQQDAYKETILSGITNPNLRKVVEIALTAKTPADLPEEGSAESAALNTTLRAAAKDSAVASRDDLEALATVLKLEKAEKDVLMASVQGNLLTYENLREGLDKTKVSPEYLTEQITDLRTQVEAMKEQTSLKGDEKEARDAKVRSLERKILFYEHLKKLYTPDENGKDGIQRFFEGMQEGTIPIQQAQAFLEAFRTGDLQEGFENLPGFERLPNESFHDWQRRIGKKAGIAALLAAIVILVAAQAVQSVGPQQGGGH